jgi:predicted PurR-regulated permease PerM
MLGIVILVQQLEGTILYPFLFSKAVKLHPMVILLSVSAGTLLAGFVGAVIAVPLVAFVTTFVTTLRNSDRIASGEEAAEPALEPPPS